MAIDVVLGTDFPTIKLWRKGKVRDVYELSDDRLLFVATDRISAFDVVLPNGIPGKGVVLTQLSKFWFEQTKEIAANHFITDDVAEYPPVCAPYAAVLEGRSMMVRRTVPLPVECIVRGYLSGSAWSEYKSSGWVSGIELPACLLESSRLPEPLFTPSTKAEEGDHDINISFQDMQKLVGKDLAEEVRDLSLRVYERSRELAEARGIIIADSKFEFGLADGALSLIDEVLTPDSSRFWIKESYAPGKAQENLDKQFVRDYLNSIAWDKTPPAPVLPPEIVKKTAQRYKEIYRILTGKVLES